MLIFVCSVVSSVSSVTIFLQIYPNVLKKCCRGVFSNCRNARMPCVSKGFRAFSLPVGIVFFAIDCGPLAVPDKILGLTLFPDFIDRGAINQLASSATGSAR